MAEQRTCDICSATPANAVIASVTLTDVVEPGTQTGHSEQADACASHQEDALAALHAHCVETLREQVPFHREIGTRAEERNAAQRDLALLGPELLEYDGREDKMPKALATKRSELLGRIAAAEAARAATLERANEAAAARKTALARALRKAN